VFKLAKNWRTLQGLLKTIGRTISDIRDFTILLFLFMFVFCLLGMDFFAEKVKMTSSGSGRK